MTRHIVCVVFAVGCAHARPVEYHGAVTVASPELVAINPDVKTVADADQPLIFARGSYWLFHDGKWHQGSSIRGPWTLAEKPPVPVAQIDQPYELVHYKKDHPTATATAAQPKASEQQQPQPQPRRPVGVPQRRGSPLMQFPK